ncbi:Six-hairpin glycosidase-like protein [Neofusicoccum parvum]|uniref:Six-hairpin glycosidase-like protein n=1 Tax=Neofusicoccum parvum TaxID=310453 RepID=A0ACB5RQ90_9PEZI|nr:Six-hairpin glycosidase-like protein [Neofusicoccum parvum]
MRHHYCFVAVANGVALLALLSLSPSPSAADAKAPWASTPAPKPTDTGKRAAEIGPADTTEISGSNDFYGSYRVLGNLSVEVDGLTDVSSYNRSLGLETGLYTTKFDADGGSYKSTVYCLFPNQVCIYALNSSGTFPDITISIEPQQATSDPQDATCGSGYVRFTKLTQAGPQDGMKYDAIARLVGSSAKTTICSNITDGALIVLSRWDTSSIETILAAGTNYDQNKGHAENNYSFKGEDPGPKDYQSLAQAFVLELPDTLGSACPETSEAIARCNTSTGYGDPFVESLIFDYGRHLLITPARPGVLPANLQGKWSQTLSVDCHANTSIQMDYWHANQTGLAGRAPSTTGTLVANPAGASSLELLKPRTSNADVPPSATTPGTAFARTASSSSTPAPTRGIEASAALPDRRHDAPPSTGPHLTAQGTAAEWKSAGLDVRGDAHRPAHLSHLLGWYPGYSLAAGSILPTNTSFAPPAVVVMGLTVPGGEWGLGGFRL